MVASPVVGNPAAPSGCPELALQQHELTAHPKICLASQELIRIFRAATQPKQRFPANLATHSTRLRATTSLKFRSLACLASTRIRVQTASPVMLNACSYIVLGYFA